MVHMFIAFYCEGCFIYYCFTNIRTNCPNIHEITNCEDLSDSPWSGALKITWIIPKGELPKYKHHASWEKGNQWKIWSIEILVIGKRDKKRLLPLDGADLVRYHARWEIAIAVSQWCHARDGRRWSTPVVSCPPHSEVFFSRSSSKKMILRMQPILLSVSSVSSGRCVWICALPRIVDALGAPLAGVLAQPQRILHRLGEK